MHKIDNRRMKLAWLLMWGYLPMLLAITFHHHAEVEGSSATFYCYDCAHHIHHDGHLTAEHGFMHDCALCQLHDLPYVVPSIIHVAAFVVMCIVAFVLSCPFVKTRKCDVHSTRAPPAFLSLYSI